MVSLRHYLYSFAFDRFRVSDVLVRADKRTYEAGHQSVYHTHDYPQIWYCYQGSYQHFLEGEMYECTEGSLMVIPAGVRHDVRFTDRDAQVLMMDVNYEVFFAADPERYCNTVANLTMPLFSKEVGFDLPFYRVLDSASQSRVEDVFSWFVLSNYAPERKTSKEEVCEKLEELFSIPECAVPQKKRKKVATIFWEWIRPAYQIIAYLNVHYPEKILEADILSVANLSHSGLNRYFKRVSGFSYTQYLLQLRVKRAYIYIRTTTYPLAYISDMCGFYDSYHMSDAFYKYIGERPKQRSIKLREYYGRETTKK